MTSSLWTSDEIAAATGGRFDAAFEVSGLSIDTRSLRPGDLFVALKDQRDGHDFVANAFEAGASGALVSRAVEGAGGPLMIVDDVQTALEALGVAARKRAKDCYRVAVTGSVGKTSVKEMIAAIFRNAGCAHWSEKSFNNQWGVPLTLARMPRDTQYAVFEIGMSTPGEIAPRSRMVAPHTALVTKVAPAHLEGLGSVEGVAREKADVFAGLCEGGAILLPEADDFRELMAGIAQAHQANAALFTFGEGGGARARILSYESDGTGSRIEIVLDGDTVSVDLKAVGAHWAENAAGALLAACAGSGIKPSAAAAALSGYAPPPGRGTAETLALPGGGKFTLVDDAYNANPESMRASLAGFAARQGARRLAALGEMLEVGAGSEEAHAGLAGPVEAADVTDVFLAGAGMRALRDALDGRISAAWESSAKSLSESVKKTLKPGDLLLIKGSNASGMGWLANELRRWSQAGETSKSAGAESASGGSDAL